MFIVIYLRRNSKNRKYLFSKTIIHMTVDLYCNENSTHDSHFSLKSLNNFNNKMNRSEPEIHVPEPADPASVKMPSSGIADSYHFFSFCQKSFFKSFSNHQTLKIWIFFQLSSDDHPNHLLMITTTIIMISVLFFSNGNWNNLSIRSIFMVHYFMV